MLALLGNFRQVAKMLSFQDFFFAAEMQHYNIVTSCYVGIHRFWRNLLCKEQNQRFPEGAALESPAVGSFAVQISHGTLYSCHLRNEWHRNWWVLCTGHKIGAGPLGFYSCFFY